MSNMVEAYTPLSILRAPRPLILMRGIRVYLKVQLPRARVNSIFRYVILLQFVAVCSQYLQVDLALLSGF